LAINASPSSALPRPRKERREKPSLEFEFVFTVKFLIVTTHINREGTRITVACGIERGARASARFSVRKK
jgi:hypothetical protein